MPLFEYRCRQCGAKFEKLVFASPQDAPVQCEQCGSEITEKLFSTFAAPGTGAASNTPDVGPGCACGSGGFT